MVKWRKNFMKFKFWIFIFLILSINNSNCQFPKFNQKSFFLSEFLESRQYESLLYEYYSEIEKNNVKTATIFNIIKRRNVKTNEIKIDSSEIEKIEFNEKFDVLSYYRYYNPNEVQNNFYCINEYDESGKLIQIEGIQKYDKELSYDLKNHLTYLDKKSGLIFKIRFEYNSSNQVTKIVRTGHSFKNFEFDYYDDVTIKKIIFGSHHKFEYNFDKNGLLVYKRSGVNEINIFGLIIYSDFEIYSKYCYDYIKRIQCESDSSENIRGCECTYYDKSGKVEKILWNPGFLGGKFLDFDNYYELCERNDEFSKEYYLEYDVNKPNRNEDFENGIIDYVDYFIYKYEYFE